MTLYKHQQQLISANPKYHGLFFDCGLGKTLTAIRLIEQNSPNCLVICPKSVKENWHREIEQWKTKESVKWMVVTKEEFKKDIKNIQQFKGLIIDEAHNFLGYKSALHKTLLQYLKQTVPKCVYALTATPYLSTPYNVMCLERIMGKNADWRSYTNRFFFQCKMGQRVINKVKSDIDGELQKIIHSCGTVRSKEECLDLPPEIFIREDFDLTKEQDKAIEELGNDLVITHISRWTKIHQICGGTLKSLNLSAKNLSKSFKAEKVQRVIEYTKMHDKLVVVCRYNAELEMLEKEIKGKCYVINGAVQNRQEILDKFEKVKKGVLLINAAVSEGFNVRGTNVMVFYSLSFSLKDRVQMIGRINGINRGVEGQPSTYIDFVVPGTIDEDVFNCIRLKTDFQIELYKI